MMGSGFSTTNPAADELRITPGTDESEAEGDEFSRFEDLTRKLVNTPKGEVDEKRKAEKD